MNEERYNELVRLVSGINGFRQMVQAESKQPIAIRLIKYLAQTTEHEAVDFINEYYSRMDLKFGGIRLDNEMQLRHNRE